MPAWFGSAVTGYLTPKIMPIIHERVKVRECVERSHKCHKPMPYSKGKPLAKVLTDPRIGIALLSLANVKYILTPPRFSFELQQSSIHRVYQGSDAEIYLNLEVMPRAFVVFNAIVAQSDREALSLLHTIDVRMSAVLTETLNLADYRGGSSEGEARILEYANAVVIVETQTSQTALLILSETYFPGWLAYLDGHPMKLLRADYAFRGVVIPSGRHVVKFVYEPASFRLGLLLSIVSLSAIIVIISPRQVRAHGIDKTQGDKRRTYGS